MASLLGLPQELRDYIWQLLATQDQLTCGKAKSSRPTRSATRPIVYRSLALTCKQLGHEVLPYMYNRVCLKASQPHDFLPWLLAIGPSNSSCIRDLIIQTDLAGFEDTPLDSQQRSAWAVGLGCMPNLGSIAFQFSHDENIDPLSAPATGDGFKTILTPLEQLKIGVNAVASHGPSFRPAPLPQGRWDYRPSLESHPFTHAFFSIGEPLPPILVQYFESMLRNKSNIPLTAQSLHLDDQSMEKDITGLPPTFFRENGFYLWQTLLFNANNEHHNVLLSFKRLPRISHSPAPLLKDMMRKLPHLKYLRLGCCEVDSSFLTHVPRHLDTIDAAFTDSDPERVAENLMTMRGICKRLFTLFIAVSPLHDRDLAGEEDNHEVVFDRRSLSPEVQKMWAPFWKAMNEIKNSKVKTWEGEAPGFKRGRSA